jgi:hypothetical protein
MSIILFAYIDSGFAPDYFSVLFTDLAVVEENEQSGASSIATRNEIPKG